MDFGLSEEQTLFQDTLNNFLADQVGLDRVRRIAGGEESAGAVWTELAELGVSALLVPEEHGGVGLKPLDAAVAAESLGHHATPSPFLGSAVMGPTALLLAGGQGERLERLAAGELRIGVALGEAIAARAEAGVSAADGKLNGKALYVLDYGADEYLVADSSRGLHLVAAGDLEHRPLSTVEKTRPTGELVFDNSPAIPLSADPAHLQAVLDAGRVMLAADTLGAAQNMLDQAVAYAKEREQFNRPIGSFQAVKHMCAEMAAHLEPCRAMVWYAGHALSEVPEEAHLTACHAKAHLAEVGTFVA
ncbi:MAG: acyl-CoA dehydrogenase, partial [Gammaproteobacteria bacterium]|nr:acyl-CoA dehydrogenase [Gammaproteobacteria bacterium]